MQNKDYVLASGSPRRIQIMKEHGIDPVIFPADIEENLPAVGGMKETVMFLALKKAKAVESLYKSGETCINHGSIIIAADTVVYKDKIMGKPADFDDAFNMLQTLKNTHHYVATGVAIVCAGCEKARVFTEITKVWFGDYSDKELTQYLKTDEAYDKAGGYAIQGYFAKYIKKIDGDYDNVVGFPWSRIEKELLKL
ncbi:MAG: septum formation protein Maf [Clostridiales bacterium]|nr:MAG: septum formation protein Maf [Clostridiales bacterium]